jgi:hypothetical protein
MSDVILFLFVFIIGYICFIGIVILARRLFFPFFTKDQLARNRRLALSK